MENRSRPLAVVTGGSSGIGLELARELARRGYDLVIGGQETSKLVLAQAELKQEGAEVTCIAADLTRPDEVERFHREASAAGTIDVLCANAGVGVGGGDFTETDLHAELRLIDLNVRSQVHLIKLILPTMVARGEGHILITSSVAGVMPGPFEAVYAASKAFDRHFGEALRNEVADKGVVVTVLKPGPTDTDFFRRAGMIGTPAGDNKKDDPALVARQGIDAMFADRHHVVGGGIMNKMHTATIPLMSDPMLASMHRMQSEPKDRQAERSSGIGASAVAGGVLLAAAGAAAAFAFGRKRHSERDDLYRYEDA